MRSALMLVAAFTSALVAQQAPAQKPPPFASGTQVVQVDVRVFDKSGHFVTDLKAEDFEIREDGVAQPIVSMTLVASGTVAPPRPSAPAPAPSAPSAPLAPSIWVFVFDTLHLSPGGLHNTQKAVEDFLRTKFRDGDLGGVIADGRMANNRMTSVRQELLKAVTDIRLPNSTFEYQNQMTREWPRILDEFEAYRIAVLNDASALQQVMARACAEDPGACKAPPDMQIRSKSQDIVRAAATGTQFTLTVVRGLANGLARMPGPKTVVFISDGFVVQNEEAGLRDATAVANRAGAHFYTIDARGLNKGSASSAIIDQPAAVFNAGPANRFDMQSDATNALAIDTGGMAIRNENNFGRALDLIQQDAGTYYVIGYTPVNQTFDGKYRKIETSVNRSGMKVRARRGYLAIEPAMLLTPSAVKTPPSAPPAASNVKAVAEPVAEPNAPAAEAAVAEPPAAKALRSSIESHALVEELQGAQRLAPGKAGELADKGWAAYQKGDVENAAVYLGEAVQSPEARPWVRYALGLAHLALGRYRDAVAAWERVRRDVPEFEPVYFNLADGYLLQKDNDGALKVLRDAQARWPADSEVWNATGVLEVRRGAIDAAVRSFTRAIAAAPDESLGFFNLARAYQLRAAQSQRFDSTRQKWIGGEDDTRKAVQHYTKYLEMGGAFVQQAKEALQVLNWKS
jgi:VWFA-related protein